MRIPIVPVLLKTTLVAGLLAAGAVQASTFPGEGAATTEVDFRSQRGYALQEGSDRLQVESDERGLRPAGRRGEAVVVSRAIAVPLGEARPFLAVGAVTRGRIPAASGLTLEIRGSADGESWSPWRDASFQGHAGDGHHGAVDRVLPDWRVKERPGELVFLDADTRFVQYRLSLTRSPFGQDPEVQGLSLHFISPGETVGPLAERPLPGDGNRRIQSHAELPSYVPRSSWGGLSNTAYHPLASVSQLVVHHTVSANSASDWAATVRGFYDYHVNTLGWSDIGYNWLVAPDGTIFQGRAHRPNGNTNVRGAHAGGHNSYTMGLSYIGTYSNVNPTQAAFESGAQVLAWKAEERGIDPSLIRGHRNYKQTSCPGDALYARLFDTLRPRVSDILDGDAPEPEPPYDTLWHQSDAVNSNPWYFGDNRQRGHAVSGDRFYVVSRHSDQWGPHVMIHSVSDGVPEGGAAATLDTSGVDGGTYALNDIATDANGALLAANLVTDLSSEAFRVYLWSDADAAPTRVVNFTGTLPHRLGDNIAVTGSVADGTARIWVPASGSPVVYRWSMSNGSFNSWPQAINLSDAPAGGSASVAPLTDGGFFWNAAGEHLRLYAADGALLGRVPGSVVARDSHAIELLGREDNDIWLAVYQFGDGNENARIVRVPESAPDQAGTLGVTRSLDSNANPNATGDITVRHNAGGSVDVFVLATNNGLGGYRIDGLDFSTVDAAGEADSRVEEASSVRRIGSGSIRVRR